MSLITAPSGRPFFCSMVSPLATAIHQLPHLTVCRLIDPHKTSRSRITSCRSERDLRSTNSRSSLVKAIEEFGLPRVHDAPEEDIELLRNCIYALGAQRIRPTTAGDFCRRLKEEDINALMEAFNEVRPRMWSQQPEEFFDEAKIDADWWKHWQSVRKG